MTDQVKKPRPSDEDGDYPGLLAHMRGYFTRALVEVPNGVLLRTDVGLLSPTFVGGLPAEYRQHYTCNTCRRFLDKDGGSVVIVDENGNVRPAAWHTEPDWKPPEVFVVSVDAMMHVVRTATPTGLFLTDRPTFGTTKTGGRLKDDGSRTDEWTHFSLTLPRERVYKFIAEVDDDAVNDEPSAEKPEKASAKYKADHEVKRRAQARLSLVQSLEEYTSDVIDRVLTYLRSGSLYRPESAILKATWFQELRRKLDGCSDARRREFMLWYAVAKSPYTNLVFRGKSVGRLFKAVKRGDTTAAITSMWNTMLSAENFMHATVAPSAGNVRRAEVVVSELRAQGSMARRYARIEEVPLDWTPRGHGDAKSVGMFAGVETRKPNGPSKDLIVLPNRTMTWAKFQSTVLPTAVNMEVHVPHDTRDFVALVTAVNPASRPVLQWDKVDRRNPFSWYYGAGVDASLRAKVMAAGGQYDDVSIRCTLEWYCLDDLDLHCIAPNGCHICYSTMRSPCGGFLDVDMNAGMHRSEKPVENIRWQKGQAPQGNYHFWVHNYSNRTYVPSTPFRAELEVNGKLWNMEGNAAGTGAQVDIARFTLALGKEPMMPTTLRPGRVAARTNDWNLVPDDWARVTGITRSPNMWNGDMSIVGGNHTIFLLENCRDIGTQTRRGLLVEMLNGEFHEVRSTLDKFFATESVADAEKATACGIGMSAQRPSWDVILRVSDGKSQTIYKIDRLD